MIRAKLFLQFHFLKVARAWHERPAREHHAQAARATGRDQKQKCPRLRGLQHFLI
jgi:hypothetical protein